MHGPYVEATSVAAEALGKTEPAAAVCVRGADDLQAQLHEVLSDASLLEARREAAARATGALEEGVMAALWRELEGPLGLPTPA